MSKGDLGFQFIERMPSACILTLANTVDICAWNQRAQRLFSMKEGTSLLDILPSLKIRRLHRKLEEGKDFEVLLQADDSSSGSPFLVRAHRIEEEAVEFDLLEVIDAISVLGDAEIYRSYARLVEVNHRTMETRLSSFPEESLDPVLASSQRGEITYRNPAVDRLVTDLGLSSEVELLPGNHAELVAQVIVTPDELLAVETTHGRRVFEWKYRSVLGGSLIHVYGNELTAVRMAEASQRQIQEQLEHMKRVASLGYLAGGIAHDFNNILTAVIGSAQLALEEPTDGPFVQENLEEILLASNRAKGIISQILLFSRTGDETKTLVSVQRILEETIRLQQVSLPETVHLRLEVKDLTDMRRFVFGDADQFHQIFMNLLENAVHAIRESGTQILVRMSAVEASNLEPPMIQIDVIDDGVGMNAQTLRHIFDPYYTTRGFGKGSGLGLAVTHGIVTKYQGRIEVQSNLGDGTTFSVLLPSFLGGPEAEHSSGSPPVAKLSTGAPLRLMVVDDEPPVARVTALMMERLGHSVRVFFDPVLALKELDRSPIDCLITDHSMPGMTGIELTSAARDLYPDLEVIICSGYGARLNEELVLGSGARALLLKPLDFTLLGELVESVGVDLHPQL